MSKSQNSPRKLLNRFYEPLILLYVLGQCQGDHLPREKDSSSSLSDASDTELRRRFLEALAYACDYEKGGDTVTAIAVSTGPLTYHVAANKFSNGGKDVKVFLTQLLKQLSRIDRFVTKEDLLQIEAHVLEHCVSYSEDRIATYTKSLSTSLQKCRATNNNPNLQKELEELRTDFTEYLGVPIDLCKHCYNLMRGDTINLIKERATHGKRDGGGRDHFTELRHFLGRLAHHVQFVKVMLAASQRFPGLVEECRFELVPISSSPRISLPVRKQLNLDGIANRMIANDKSRLQEVQADLHRLDRVMKLETRIRELYVEKSIKPRVHAEIALLEYCYSRRDTFRFFDNDRYIGVSKPACYCCDLYIREHPGNFVQPPTHQKIWLNWLPPVGATKLLGRDFDQDQDIHGQRIVNQMVQKIRAAALGQITNRTGMKRPRRQHDSVTWSTFHRPSMPDAEHSRDRFLQAKGEHHTHTVPSGLAWTNDGKTSDNATPEDRDVAELSARFASQNRIISDESDAEEWDI